MDVNGTPLHYWVNDRENKRKLNFIVLLGVLLRMDGVFLMKDRVLIQSCIVCAPQCLCEVHGPYWGVAMVSPRQWSYWMPWTSSSSRNAEKWWSNVLLFFFIISGLLNSFCKFRTDWLTYWISKYVLSGLDTQLSVGWTTGWGREHYNIILCYKGGSINITALLFISHHVMLHVEDRHQHLIVIQFWMTVKVAEIFFFTRDLGWN